MSDLATEKQIAYIKDLGGIASDGLSKEDASRLISRLLATRTHQNRQENSSSLTSNNNTNKPISRLDKISPPLDSRDNTKGHTSPDVSNSGFSWGCFISFVACIVIGGYFLFTKITAPHDNRLHRAHYTAEYLEHAGVYISRFGACYHLFPNCISLDNPNAYVEISRVPRSSVNGSHRPCEICHRNAGYYGPLPKYFTNNYNVGICYLTDSNSDIPSSHHIRGPGNRNEFTPISILSGLLWAGFNVELDGDWKIVDIWGPDGNHYNSSGEWNSIYKSRSSAWMWIDERNNK